MMLKGIHCIQFYLYEKITVELGEISGIFGPNGAGKSSLIDAVQIAMFGGNQKLVSLNAQADDKIKSTRTIRGYCLGQYDAQPNQRVRERSLSYITLVWHEPNTNRPVSMGLCIAASGDQDEHEVLGRYIADGVDIAQADHISLENGQERPRDWRSFRADLARRMDRVGGHETEIFYDNGDRYIKAYLTLMSVGKDAGSISLFKRAFRFGLRMRFEKSVDSIVRDEVLEPRPTRVKAFKEIMDTFRHLRFLVDTVEKKIQDGEEIIRHFSEAEKLEKRAAAWEILQIKVNFSKSQEEAKNAEIEANSAQQQWSDAIKSRAELDELINNSELEESRVKLLRDSHKAHDRLSMLNVAIDRDKKSAILHQGEAQKKVNDLRKIMENASLSVDLGNLHERICTSIAQLRDLKISPDCAFDVELIIHAVAQSKMVLQYLFTQHRQLEIDLEEKKNEKDNIERNIDRTRNGKTSLPTSVTQLMCHLANHGIQSVPVCDVVRVSETSWQPAIESFLGEHNLVALLVDEGHEKEAFKLYRQLDGRGAIFGVKLLMPSRIQKKQTIRGSVAELIVGDDDNAVAFLRNIFGDIRCAETNEEALSGGRALTRDGMYVGRDTFERRRLSRLDELRLGVQSDAHATTLIERLSELKREINRLLRELERIRPLMASLGAIPDADVLIRSINAELAMAHQYQRDINAAETSLKEMGGDEYQTLCEELIEISKKIKTFRDLHTSALRLEGKAESDFNSRKAVAVEKILAAQAAREKIDIKLTQTIYDVEYGESRWNDMWNTFKGNWAAMFTHCSDQYQNRSQEMTAAANRGLRLTLDFLQKYQETPGQQCLDDWHQTCPWITQLVQQLNNTQLVSYREQMMLAEQASQETFRTDVALTLQNNLTWLDQQFKRLNSVLSRSPAFSNGERYEFKRTVRKDYEDLLRFVENVATYYSGEDAFSDENKVPAQFLSLLDEITGPGSAGARSPIEDYREFFEFDVNILRDDMNTGRRKVVSQLSKRIGHGSGGEHRAPLYVIAGAALASAYNMDGREKEGMRLILLDEAFNKMDIQNIIATMRYLESLGLQIFLASPGENLAILTAFMHRYYHILRDAEHNVVTLEASEVSNEAREIMRSDLPEFHPQLIDKEVLASKMATSND